jgi:hypothetical protein
MGTTHVPAQGKLLHWAGGHCNVQIWFGAAHGEPGGHV